MAERINRIGADKYTIEVNEAGEIILNTGVDGKVTISGDLDVLGDTTTIGSSELTVDDKTITINLGDPAGGGGINDLLDGYGRSAGVIIYRGPDANEARMFYDEDLDTWRSGAVDSAVGAFSFRLGNGDYAGIHTSSIVTESNQDLYLIGQGTGTVTVSGVTDYERQVWQYDGTDVNFSAGPIAPGKADALINAQGVIDYVDSYHLEFFQPKIEKDDSRVEIFDADVDGGTSKVEIAIDDSIYSTFFDNRVEFGNLRITSDPGDVAVITSNGINSNIRLRGTGTGVVQIDGWQNFTIEADPADAPDAGVTIYSKTLGDGGTGLYFYNEDGTQDEFVSRNKALLYSIIF